MQGYAGGAAGSDLQKQYAKNQYKETGLHCKQRRIREQVGNAAVGVIRFKPVNQPVQSVQAAHGIQPGGPAVIPNQG